MSRQTNPLQVPKQGPYREGGPFRGHFAYLSKTSSFEFPSKRALPQGPLYRIPHIEMPPRSLFRERCPIPRAPSSSNQSSQKTGPPPGSPNGAPMKRDARLQSLFYISFRVPSKGALPPGSLHRAPTKTDTPPPEPLSIISQSPW
jgi:hypothetical protein